MASPLTQRALQTISDGGFARAKKLAALAIKTNTDSSGGATARGYELALSYLTPFMDSSRGNEAIDAQSLIAGYNNNLDRLSSKNRDQNETVAAFKLQEADSYFTSFDGDIGGFRDPSSLIDTTSESLDSLLVGVINAIDEKEARGDSTDALYSYMNDLNKRANSMRDLRNKLQSGELTGKALDGFGYYVDTNPLDGSIRGAALMPIGSIPEGVSTGYKRLEATTNVGGALLPVYAPAQQDEMGEYVARVGDATWSGSGSGALQVGKATNSKNLFKEGEFSISDPSLFPIRKNSVDKGSFARGFVGKDAEGNAVEAVFYRGNDNKLYQVDNNTLEQFKADPLLSKKLNGYIPQFSPTEVRQLSSEAVPFSPERVKREGQIAGFQSEDATTKAEAERMEGLGFFARLREGGKRATAEEPVVAPEETPASAPTVRTSFFNKNEPTPPAEPTVGNSANDIVEQGKGFFRNVRSFIKG